MKEHRDREPLRHTFGSVPDLFRAGNRDGHGRAGAPRVAFAAFHWIAELRFAKPAVLLRPGGALASPSSSS